MNKAKNTLRPPDEAVLAGLGHLEHSSRILLTTSPALSAYLACQKNIISSAEKIPNHGHASNKQCQACGNALIPGWSCRKSRPKPGMELKSSKHKKSMTKTSSPVVTKPAKKGRDHVLYECLLCHSVSRCKVFVPKKEAEPAVVKAVDKATTAPAISVPAIPAPAQPVMAVLPEPVPGKAANQPTNGGTANSVRKRSKKTKAGGLAALLAKSKSESASPSGFDLMDFMKTA